MTSKDDKQRRKEKLLSLRQKQQENKVAQMPLSKNDLANLFNYLDEKLGDESCDHSLRLTQAYIESKGLPFEKVKVWLAQYGGYCDCEVLANVEEEFKGII